MTEPRLFPEYAHNPTRAERGRDRQTWQDRQGAMFDIEPEPEPYCHACAGNHADADCTAGTAGTFPTTTGH